MAGSKTYTIHTSCINVTGGRYKSSSPSAAAKKAATSLFRKASKMQKYKSYKKITFCLRESTSGSDKKMFEYSATRVKLVKPIVRVINGVEIINRYKVTTKAMKSSRPKKGKSMKKTKGGCNCSTS